MKTVAVTLAGSMVVTVMVVLVVVMPIAGVTMIHGCFLFKFCFVDFLLFQILSFQFLLVKKLLFQSLFFQFFLVGNLFLFGSSIIFKAIWVAG